MCPRPRDGSADDGLSSSLLRFVDDDQLGPLRHALSDFNHRCRNLLNGMKMSFYLAKRSSPGPLSERWGELDQTYCAVEQLFERLSTIYRTMPLTLMKLRFGSLVDERSRGWAAWFQQNGNTLTLEPPDREAIGEFDAMRLITAIDAFVAWRAESMPRGGRAFLKWATDGGCFQLAWREQASDLTQPEAAVSDPFPARGSLAAATGSLSLPLLARVISEHRGRLTWTREPHVEARIRWPLFVSPPAPRITEDAQAASGR
ncbi:hypothetical protein [Paludisphaera borealis]|uniref:Uncharacterized protein n=1 Tax=Paludisphaera borealis TaxID=1387353 RepID=A0A1U7CQ06_9BACT|nr:hypothetical protein [Paludisphaera borealis]APW61001.1 hypothetical protein BSF38_02500 [Paludisphaera borealis]